MTSEEDNLRAFEAAMRWHGFNPPQRRAAGPGAFEPYESVRDSDRYRGWCMAREAAAVALKTAEIKPNTERMTMTTTALLQELAGHWEVMAEMEKDSKPGRRETLRECVDGLRMLAEIIERAEVAIAQKPKTAREAALEELLRSACAIADRRGENTAWERFAASVRAVGLNGVTARIYRVLPSDTEGEPTRDDAARCGP